DGVSANVAGRAGPPKTPHIRRHDMKTGCRNRRDLMPPGIGSSTSGPSPCSMTKISIPLAEMVREDGMVFPFSLQDFGARARTHDLRGCGDDEKPCGPTLLDSDWTQNRFLRLFPLARPSKSAHDIGKAVLFAVIPTGKRPLQGNTDGTRSINLPQ